MMTQYEKLVKFTNYSDDLMAGKLYCNSLTYFRNAEPQKGMGDPSDGMLTFSNGKSKCLPGDEYFVFSTAMMPLVSVCDDGKMGYYRLTDEQIEHAKKYGTSDCVTIVDVDGFIRKVMDACEKRGICVYKSNVLYVDKKHPAQEVEEQINKCPICLGFYKEPFYHWQKEYRFLFTQVPKEMVENGHFVLEIGSLENLALNFKQLFPSEMNE